LLKVDDDDGEFKEELGKTRARILAAGLEAAEKEPPTVAVILKKQLRQAMSSSAPHRDPEEQTPYDAGLVHAVAAQRALLHELRRKNEVTDDVYRRLEEELDWVELAASPSHEIEVLEA
jgi:CPA1 family monovalent cation:H+ antiporter